MKINYIPMWENEDVLQYAKTELIQNELESTEIVFKNYQISDDLDCGTDKKYYEIYESRFYVDEETTEKEFNNLIIENEKLIKSYKTQNGLIKNLIKSKHEVNQFEYNVINIL
ncbi:terminal repeat-encoded protein [Staphylococcus phage vB_Sau_S24]|nr:hypothetical protein vBSauClo6_141 [Staphylococcus phage vB_Sau_Clo6]ARM69494.1 terminal repeat-encoded protein [Staphylococcus phage vB_Sau_S24]